jgi:hypothetical protein
VWKISTPPKPAPTSGTSSPHTAAPNVVVSHADPDHYNRIPNVLDDVTPTSIWQGGDPTRYTEANFPEWLEQEDDGAVVHRNFTPGFHNDGEPMGNDLSCGAASTFILTTNGTGSDNRQSLVLMIEFEDFTAIFTGDAEGPTETQARTNFDGNVKATVITSSHHGPPASTATAQRGRRRHRPRFWCRVPGIGSSIPGALPPTASPRSLRPRACGAVRERDGLHRFPDHPSPLRDRAERGYHPHLRWEIAGDGELHEVGGVWGEDRPLMSEPPPCDRRQMLTHEGK